jgi:riboflavin biosynthesis pyrimidine reductase
VAIKRLFDSENLNAPPEALYERILFPSAPPDRPYAFVNMVSTVDGKVVLGARGGPSKGVGGPTDQLLLRRLERCADACLIGGGTLRAGPVIYPPDTPRYAVTGAGDVPLDNRFFRDAPGRAGVFAPAALPEARRQAISAAASLYIAGNAHVDPVEMMRILRQELGYLHVLCEGGPTLNDELFRLGLVDELFLTISPKIRGGGEAQTIVAGKGFPEREFAPLELISLYRDESEIYLRYRVRRG